MFFGVALSFFYLVTLAIFLSIVGQWQLIQTGPNVCCVPVLISGNAVGVGSSDEPRIRFPRLMPSISPDPDLGPDPSPGSAMRGSGLYVNLRRKKTLIFKQIFIFKPDFGPVVVFLGLSPPSWALHVI